MIINQGLYPMYLGGKSIAGYVCPTLRDLQSLIGLWVLSLNNVNLCHTSFIPWPDHSNCWTRLSLFSFVRPERTVGYWVYTNMSWQIFMIPCSGYVKQLWPVAEPLAWILELRCGLTEPPPILSQWQLFIGGVRLCWSHCGIYLLSIHRTRYGDHIPDLTSDSSGARKTPMRKPWFSVALRVAQWPAIKQCTAVEMRIHITLPI